MRRNSGLVGKKAAISRSSAGGIYDTTDVLYAKKSDTWPAVKKVLSITQDFTELNEGMTVTFSVRTTDYVAGEVLYFTTTAVTGTILASDFNDSTLSGSFTVNAGSVSTFSRTLTFDGVSETDDSFTVQIRSGSVSGPILATSDTVVIRNPTFSITPSASSFTEDSSILTFNVTTTNLANGTLLYYSIAGISAADISTSLTGSFTINNNAGSFSIASIADLTTEGNETLSASVRVGSVSGTIVATSDNVTLTDTSLTPAATVTPSAFAFDEGTAISINVATTNYPSGTLYYTVENVSNFEGSADVTPISGSFTVSASAGSFNITATADGFTEGNETFIVRVRLNSTTGTVIGTSSNIVINDTSSGTLEPTEAWTTNLITQQSAAHSATGQGPIANYYRRSVFVVTYTSAEIEAACGKTSGNISKLRFSVVTQPTYQPYPLYAIGMKLTTNTATTNNSASSGGIFTTVKAQSSESFTSGAVKEFTFTTNFAWTAGNNLVISFAWGQCPTNYSSSGTVPTGAGTSFYSWTDSAGTFLVTDSAPNITTYRPVLQLYM